MAVTHTLIMSAGSGDRFGEPKQYAKIGGRPMLVCTLQAFASHPGIDAMTVVVAPGEEARTSELIERFELSKVRAPVVGGATRQESVSLGLMSIGEEAERVLIHDAARPCVSEALITATIAALDEHPAVIPALPATDTLVYERDGQLEAVLDRAGIAGVQTPQGFHTELIVKAHRKAASKGLAASDDGSLVYALGVPVATIAGERTNIKVTYEDDVRIAEAILELQKQDR